jgi:prolyl 4-hydroxylase
MFFIEEVPNFVSPQVCDSIIQSHKDKTKPSTTGIGSKFEGKSTGRTSETAEANSNLEPLKDISLAIEYLTLLPQENQEKPSIIKYTKGGFYRPHYDAFNEEDEDFQLKIVPNGGQRICTCLLYLNDGFLGGKTYFPKIKRKIIPEKGKLVWWNNTMDDGRRLDESLHSGEEVKLGEKWIMTIWIRLGKTNANR